MTSNLAGQHAIGLSAEDTSTARRRALDALREFFKPEFLKRIDDVVVFRPLDRDDIGRIIELQLEHLRRLLAERKMTLELTDAARELLFREGYEPAYGARPMKRALQRLVQDPLAQKILQGEVLPGDHIVADARQDEMVFDRSPAAVSVS
jgi:ATP-dependent Clp protease ATP-binding subunit ClpB